MYRKIRCDGYCSTFLEFGVGTKHALCFTCEMSSKGFFSSKVPIAQSCQPKSTIVSIPLGIKIPCFSNKIPTFKGGLNGCGRNGIYPVRFQPYIGPTRLLPHRTSVVLASRKSLQGPGTLSRLGHHAPTRVDWRLVSGE